MVLEDKGTPRGFSKEYVEFFVARGKIVGALSESKTGATSLREGDMPTGTVKWFNMAKGYGFIQPDDGGPDVFVHMSAVLASGLPELREGQTLEFAIEPAKGGKTAAANLKLL